MIRALVLVLLTLILTGCAFHTKPFVAYADSAHPLSDTSVFSTQGLSGNALGQIFKVDGVSTSCWQVGCPIWVRVVPGTHIFTIRYSIVNNGIASHLQGDTDFEIADMKPRHVYEANFIIEKDGTAFRTSATDLGENPEYGIYVGLKGVNQKYNKVGFAD